MNAFKFNAAQVKANATKFSNDVADAEVNAATGLAEILTGCTKFADWEKVRTTWVSAYSAASKASEGAANTAWSRLVKASGAVKPASTSAAAQRKAEQRAKAKAEAKGDAKPEAPKVGKGEAKADKVKYELSAHETHLLGLIRQCKWSMAADFLAKMAEMAAPV